MRLRYCVVALSVLLGGCGIRTRYTPLNASPHELHVQSAADVPIIEEVPAEAHIEIGTIEAQRMSSNNAKKDELYRAIREVAAEHGCDAARIVGRIPDGRYGFQAACIVYKTSAPQAPVRPAAVRPASTPSTPPAQAAEANDAGS